MTVPMLTIVLTIGAMTGLFWRIAKPKTGDRAIWGSQSTWHVKDGHLRRGRP